ncbi:MAG: hypothetical protein COB07_08855 [Sulfurovum sp.]|nr:MAG: hypothetical protein COB07_08855 [Sulfurovum sp.]
MKKLLLMIILITLDVHAICTMIPHTDGSTSVEIDGKHYGWTSLSIEEKYSCLNNKIVRENREIKNKQQKNIKLEKSDAHYRCIITTNSDGSRSAEIDDLYKDWSILTDHEKASCLKDKIAREKEIKNKHQKNIKLEKPDGYYTCIMFTLDTDWVAEIDGKYYDWSRLTDREKASCLEDKIAREKEIKNTVKED